MKSDALAVQVEQRILLIRGQKVMLDADLAELYGVPTKSLNLAVKRNAERFPEDFMFQLTGDEAAGLRFHFETSKTARGGRRYRPYAFTEQGVAMLSSVLRSLRAVQVNLAIMRTFVRLRANTACGRGAERCPDPSTLGGERCGFGVCFWRRSADHAQRS